MSDRVLKTSQCLWCAKAGDGLVERDRGPGRANGTVECRDRTACDERVNARLMKARMGIL